MNFDLENLTSQAQERIRQLGMPRRNNDLWSFFPVNKIPAPEFMNGASATAATDSSVISEADIANENDLAALLPIANRARIMKKVIDEGANEMGIIKCNDDFGHSVFEIGKGAKVSLEILDNKVNHELAAERFDISVGENADVEIFFANPANDLPLRFRHFHIVQGKNSVVRMSNILQDAGMGRISVDCDLNGEGANFEYKSLMLLKGNASQHSRITINHNAPRTTSDQFVRNLLDENSYVSYDGKVIAQKDCAEVHSGQLVNTILLSEGSAVSVKPALKIYHDNVECSHGNTVGELDADQMFYLESRGIPKEPAQKMLINSFARELFVNLPETPAKKRLLQVLGNLK